MCINISKYNNVVVGRTCPKKPQSTSVDCSTGAPQAILQSKQIGGGSHRASKQSTLSKWSREDKKISTITKGVEVTSKPFMPTFWKRARIRTQRWQWGLFLNSTFSPRITSPLDATSHSTPTTSNPRNCLTSGWWELVKIRGLNGISTTLWIILSGISKLCVLCPKLMWPQWTHHGRKSPNESCGLLMGNTI